MLHSTMMFRVLILSTTVILASCGKGKPVEGEILNMTLASVSLPSIGKRQVPLDIINGGGTHDLDSFAAHLKAEGFNVETSAVNGFGFQGITDNKINHVDVTDFSAVTVTARKEKSDQDGGLKQEIRATFENGVLRSGSWTLKTWLEPRQDSIIPYADPQKMEIKQAWADNILARYGFSPLKGEQIRAGLGVMVKNTRRDDNDAKCFNPDGSHFNGSGCGKGIEISYQASYELDDESRAVCWYGVCQLRFSYYDAAPEQYRQDLNAALANLYRQKFGEIDSTK